jgi:FeS assembly SUF system protein
MAPSGSKIAKRSDAMIETEDRSIDVASATRVEAEVDETTPACGDAGGTDAIVAALRTVHDPEIPVNIYDLGLIYKIEIKDHGIVEIEMTLTAPGCPVAGEMVSMVQRAVLGAAGVSLVNVSLVFDPPWDQSKMSEEAKLELGFY